MRTLVLFLTFLFSMQAVAQEYECDGPYKNKRLTEHTLKTVLEEHTKWLSDIRPFEALDRADPRWANLCEANLGEAYLSGVDLSMSNLSKANLSGAILTKADLSGANLSMSNLSRTNLHEANLSGANLRVADLSNSNMVAINLIEANLNGANLSQVDLSLANLKGAKLGGANLEGVNLSGAKLGRSNLNEANLYGASLNGSDLRRSYLRGTNLRNTDLRNADLSGANMSNADLSRAYLSKTELRGANLYRANVTEARFYINPLSDVIGLRGISGLSNIKIIEEMNPIVVLRKQFKEAGFKNEVKALTSALRKRELSQASIPEQMLTMYVMGGLLTDFGADSSVPVIMLFALIFLFFWFYLVALQAPEEDHGIWRLRPKERVLKKSGESEHELILFRGFWRTIPIALYFSTLSAFHFGWREFNLGNWIIRLQRREYTLAATGWVRSTSGIQSLISLYLIALSLLTYFGNPFE